MKTNWKAIGIAAASAAVLYYPSLKLYQYIKKRIAGGRMVSNENHNGHHAVKAFITAYRGKRKVHHG